MRVAIFTESYEPIVNGVSVSVATLRDGLRSRGHGALVFAPRYPGHTDESGTVRFPSRMSRYAPGYPLPIPYSAAAWKEFRHFSPDIVHTHSPFLLGMTGLRWARRVGVPVVTTNHTMYTEYAHYVPLLPQRLTRAALVRLMKWYYSTCDSVVTPSKVVADVLRGYGVRNQIEIIGSGIRPRHAERDPEVRARYGIQQDAVLLLYVGRIAKEKNLSLLLQSFAKVRESDASVRLLIAGSGPDLDNCRQLAQDVGAQDAVVFTGMVSHEEVDSLYAAADLFVFPSITETQGLVVCEAMAAGLPCVAVRAAATPEVLTDGVDSILTENSVESFSRAVLTAAQDAELRERLSTGALTSFRRFSVEAMTEHFETFYQTHIDQKRSSLVTVGG